MKLYSYCLRYDNGAAPNPFWGICTLVICKPKIRQSAEIGDWIVGTGSANSDVGNLAGKLVYAMQVTAKMTMRDYDDFCQKNYPNKLPRWRAKEDYRLRLGDCIYDYSNGDNPKLRLSVHKEENQQTDMGGKYALISDQFYYFGDNSRQLPEALLGIVRNSPGHRSDANEPFIESFLQWLSQADLERNKLYGEPQRKKRFLIEDDSIRGECARRDLEQDEEDENC